MEMNEGKDFIINLFKKITIKDAVIFTKLAWDDVQDSTIKNCWIHTKLVSSEQDKSISATGSIEVN